MLVPAILVIYCSFMCGRRISISSSIAWTRAAGYVCMMLDILGMNYASAAAVHPAVRASGGCHQYTFLTASHQAAALVGPVPLLCDL